MIDGTTKRAIRSGWAPTNTSNLVHLLYFSVIWVVNNGNIKRAITKSGSRPSCEPSEMGNLTSTSNNIMLGDISLYLEFMSNSSSLWIALGRQTQINFQKLSAKVMKYTWCEMGFLGPQHNSLKRKDFEHLLIEPITEAVMFCSKLLIRGRCFDKNDLSDIFQRLNTETLLGCEHCFGLTCS